MTNPSETRAGKLRALADRMKFVCKDQPHKVGGLDTLDGWVMRWAGELEALAASEPVEAVAWQFRGVIGSTPTEWMELEPHRVDTVSKSPGYEVRPLYTHPAPEQPGKGETYRAPASPEAMRENQSQPTFMREPHPSDPAEGDVLLEELQFLSEVAFDATCCNSNFPISMLRRVVKQAMAALSTPTTAAVRIDDEEFRKFDNGVRTWLARRYIQTWDKIRAALDPQVKR